MPPKTTPKTKKPEPSAPPRQSRAEYFRLRREAKKEATKGRHWSLEFLEALTPFLERALTAYTDRTAKLGTTVIQAGPFSPGEPLPAKTGLELFTASSGAAEPEAPAPAGHPSLVVGKYLDDPTGELEVPLFNLDTDLTDACQTWLRTNHPEEIVNLRLYDEIEGELGLQLMRALFKRIGAPIPADDPAVAKAFYNQPF
jgi:hypothetical protein